MIELGQQIFELGWLITKITFMGLAILLNIIVIFCIGYALVKTVLAGVRK